MSYLDLLKDDNMEMIFKYATDDLEQTILKLSKKINKLKLRLRPLSINYYSEDDYTDIRYDNVVYSMDNYLFNTFQDEEDLPAIQCLSTKPCIVIIKYFNEYFSNGDGITFISNKLKTPTYLDILIEADINLNTEVKKLSGGQKQRVSIARALIKNPKILLFDDCLSAVDTETEEAILNNLFDFCKSKTTIIVSHRISSAKNADKIIVLEDGKVIQQGSHNQLINIEGYYKELYAQQLSEKEMK
jgi:hypothetical protein